MIARYPDTLPCPSQSGYSFGMDHNYSEITMQNGWTVRRQREPFPVRTATLSFTMNTKEFFDWYNFCMEAAYRWITMNVQTDKTLFSETTVETLRFISDISYTYGDWDTIQATVQAEFNINHVTGEPI